MKKIITMGYIGKQKVKKRTKSKSKNPFTLFFKALKHDPDFYLTYQANIAMSFIDEFNRQGHRDSNSKIRTVANQAAINFLNLLINGVK